MKLTRSPQGHWCRIETPTRRRPRSLSADRSTDTLVVTGPHKRLSKGRIGGILCPWHRSPSLPLPDSTSFPSRRSSTTLRLFGLASCRNPSRFRCRTGTERFWQNASQRIVRARVVLARGASFAMKCGRSCVLQPDEAHRDSGGAPRPLCLALSGLPPEIGRRGHSLNQDANWCSEGNGERSRPTSVRMIISLPVLSSSPVRGRGPILRPSSRFLA